MSFTITGLPLETFQPLFDLDEVALAERGIMRVTAAEGRYPCRVSLEDAAPGETLLLLNYQAHDLATPYRFAYAIYVNESAAETRHLRDETTPVLRGRPIALRAFDSSGMLIAMELVLPADDIDAAIERQLANPDAAYLHAYNAAAGCFAARVDRA